MYAPGTGVLTGQGGLLASLNRVGGLPVGSSASGAIATVVILTFDVAVALS